jgi:hypothetical protein
MTITRNYPHNPILDPLKSMIRALNGRWHKRAMQIFMLVILIHLSEHIAQIIQLWVLGWTRKESMGLLGLAYPWMMKSESLHYAHALFMLVGLAVLRPAIVVSPARLWWDVSFVIQFWHHLEHALLFGQAIIKNNFADFAAPVSIAQLVAQYFSGQPFAGQPWLPRIELHLFYNLIVLFPMLIALYYHRFPPQKREAV